MPPDPELRCLTEGVALPDPLRHHLPFWPRIIDVHSFAGEGNGAEGKGIGVLILQGVRETVSIFVAAHGDCIGLQAPSTGGREGAILRLPFTFLTNPIDFFTIIPFTDFLHSSLKNFYFLTR